MRWQKAWQIPVEIDRAGCLDPALLASKSETDLIELLDGLAVRPRYGVKHGARTLLDAARLVWERFGGDAGTIWNNSSPRRSGEDPAGDSWTRTWDSIHGDSNPPR